MSLHTYQLAHMQRKTKSSHSLALYQTVGSSPLNKTTLVSNTLHNDEEAGREEQSSPTIDLQ